MYRIHHCHRPWCIIIPLAICSTSCVLQIVFMWALLCWCLCYVAYRKASSLNAIYAAQIDMPLRTCQQLSRMCAFEAKCQLFRWRKSGGYLFISIKQPEHEHFPSGNWARFLLGSQSWFLLLLFTDLDMHFFMSSEPGTDTGFLTSLLLGANNWKSWGLDLLCKYCILSISQSTLYC